VRCLGFLLDAALAPLLATAAAAQVNGSVSFDQGTLVQVPPTPSFDWHHLAGTFDGTTMRLFWDGVEVASSVHPRGVGTNSAPRTARRVRPPSLRPIPEDGRSSERDSVAHVSASHVVCTIAPEPPEERGSATGRRR
jgi:concanavalin A-like lectin/glucanase superfamily protein